MDDFGNIIYVIVAIGWFLWNAYKKSQEGKQQPKPQRESRPQVDPKEQESSWKTFEDMILGQLEGNEAPKPEPIAVETVPPRHKHQDKFLNADLDHSHLPADYKMSVGERGSHRVQRQVTRLKVDVVEEQPSLMDGLFPEGFDLKKAVVLDAVLNRPYS